MSKWMIVEVPSYSCEFRGIREIGEIVRCGECKWEWTQKCPPHRMGLIHDENDYCSYGVKKGADDDSKRD